MKAKPTTILLLELEIRFCPPRSRKIQLLTIDGHGFESHLQKGKKVGGVAVLEEKLRDGRR